MRKLLITSISLIGAVCLLLGGAFWFREDLARFAAGRFLADGQLTLTRLQGLQVTSTQLTVDELEFLLNESGQRLVIADLDVDFRVRSVSSAPSVEAVTIGSARLLAAPAAEEGAAIIAEDDPEASGTMLSEMLTLLREFPLASVKVNALTLPQRSAPIAFELQRGEGMLGAQVESGVLRLEAVFTQAEATTAANLGLSLTRGEASVGNFELVLTPMGAVYALAGNGKLDVPDLAALLGDLEQASRALPLKGAQLDWDIAGSVADDLQGVASNDTPQTFVVGLQAGSQVMLPAELASGLGAVTVALTDPAAFTINSGAGLTVGSSGVPLHVVSTWKEQAVDLAALLTLTDCELAATAICNIGVNGNATLGAYSLAGGMAVALQGAGKYRVATEGLALAGLPGWLPAFDVAADITVSDQAINFRTPLILRNASTDAGITLEGDYDRTTGAAEVHVTLPELTFMETGGALSTWFGAWPYTFDLLTGSVAAGANLTWSAGKLTGSVSAYLNDAGGFYGDYFFRGVNGEVQAALDTGAELPVGIAPTTLTVAGLDIGVPMENLRLDFSLEPAGILQIEAFSTELLDGTITGMDITYDFNRERNDVLVQFSGLQIERMLELVEYKGIAAEGAVSGEIPLTITSTGVEVAQGMLAADAPGGSIRYLAAATEATGNPGLDLMNQALSNYQFESLTSGIEYKPDGELVLEMKLQGHNPEMQGGQRINLNLNLSDNIPALLESLQAARKIEDFLELQYQ